MTEDSYPQGYVRVDLADFAAVQVVVPLTGDTASDSSRLTAAIAAAVHGIGGDENTMEQCTARIRGLLVKDAPRGQGGNRAPAQRQQVASQQQGGQGQSRADQYPIIDGMTCDQCGGPAGRYPQKGQMSSDKAVCLGKCMDPGGRAGYIHTISWLDDDAVPAGVEEDDIPL